MRFISCARSDASRPVRPKCKHPSRYAHIERCSKGSIPAARRASQRAERTLARSPSRRLFSAAFRAAAFKTSLNMTVTSSCPHDAESRTSPWVPLISTIHPCLTFVKGCFVGSRPARQQGGESLILQEIYDLLYTRQALRGFKDAIFYQVEPHCALFC